MRYAKCAKVNTQSHLFKFKYLLLLSKCRRTDDAAGSVIENMALQDEVYDLLVWHLARLEKAVCCLWVVVEAYEVRIAKLFGIDLYQLS